MLSKNFIQRKLLIVLIVNFLLILFIIPAAADFTKDKDGWTAYPQPANGKIYLPGEWSLVSLWDEAEMIEKNFYKQNLINAHQVHDGLTCSMAITRCWWTQGGKVLKKHKQDMAKLIIEAQKDIFSKFRSDSLKTQKINNRKFWSLDLSYMESVALSACSEIKDDNYWRPIFDKILKKWQIGKSLGEKEANILPDKGSKDEWKEITLQNAGVISIPADWTIVDKDATVQSQKYLYNTLYHQLSLNVRGSRHNNENSSVMINAIWPAQILLAGKTLEQLLSEMTTGLYKDSKQYKNTVERDFFEIHGRKVPFETVAFELQPGLALRTKFVILEHDDKILSLMVTYNAKNEDKWAAIVQEILSLWKLNPPRSNTQLTYAENSSKTTSYDDYSDYQLLSQAFSHAKSVFISTFISGLLLGLLGAIPAFILRFVFRKRYKLWQAFLWGILFCILSVMMQTLFNPSKMARGGGDTIVLTLILLTDFRKKNNLPEENTSDNRSDDYQDNQVFEALKSDIQTPAKTVIDFETYSRIED